ncbi:class I glutamine amidotransferase-like protein [Schizophyllum commune Tattone D]|nr:class I glutamine amidotransferase-like protein [Schizophyllum commune Tattone D]
MTGLSRTMTDSSPKSLSLGVCLYNGLTCLDFQGVVENLCLLTKQQRARIMADAPGPEITPITYLADTLDPVKPGFSGEAGPRLMPDATYSETTQQFDILLIPGGVLGYPDAVPKSLLDFLKRQVPGVTYMLTVCTGSWVLSATGLLDERRATTNKSWFKKIAEATASHNIQWVPKARWVVDGKFWTASGVSAGMDMANSLVKELIGEEGARLVANDIEMHPRSPDDDEFAAVYGLA